MRRTTDRTPSRRWLVPRYVGAASARAATASERIFDGPEPKRPSDGNSSLGSRMSVMRPSLPTGRFLQVLRSARHLALAGRALGAGPVRRHAAASHAAERDGIADSEEDVAEHGDPHAEREPVVNERCARTPVVRERVGPAKDQPGGEHDDDGTGEERRVELLTRVELAGVEPAGPDSVAATEPAGVVPRPAVDATEIVAEPAAPASGEPDEHGQRQQDPGVHVDLPEQ